MAVIFTHFQQRIGNFIAVFPAHSDQQFHYFFLNSSGKPCYHSQIHQCHFSIRCDMNIARMRVCMYQSVHNNLLHIGFGEFVDKRREISLCFGERTDLSDFFSLNIIHGQNPGSGIILHRLRNNKPWKISQIIT